MATTQLGSETALGTHAGAESSHSAVSWGAIIGGAVIAAALTATLLIGGTGLGFMAISPWGNDGASGTTMAIGTIVWLFVTQIVAYGIAGYVTGRLRTNWAGVHGDEVHFRDTAHGFLVWAVSVVVSVFLLGSGVASVVSGTAQAGANLAGAGVGAASAVVGQAGKDHAQGPGLSYFTDALLRPADPANASAHTGNPEREVSRILARSLKEGEVSQQDQDYLLRLVANRTGLTPEQAKERLDSVQMQAKETAEKLEQQAREAADTARKAAAAFALWAFASLLVGAFVASLAATIGGRARITR
ncbi:MULTISPECIES: hypothetical protein [Alcaligenes]|uniref:Mll5186 protein n=2 Tax=Alcaligenes TaxID=507 RepID=A0AB33D1B8_ALCFA|nr:MULTISPECIES: hypothetical protein [Alcaligenes]ASR89314.1 hypothetical protein AFA_07585 [Alcaligenes faecalis]AYN20627.1 hypothetical protein D3M96_08850 [Alcaligenes aquatilis]QXR37413.1 hypothetical protein EGK70_007970 [Alcaligenes aquatilis]